MRIERRNYLLLALVAGAAWAHFGLRVPTQPASATPALFTAFDPAEVRRIEIEEPLGAEEVALLELQRDEDGWILPQAHGARAYTWSVDALLAGLRGVRDADLVSERSDSWTLYGVGTSGTRVRVVGSGGVALASFVQGRALAEDGGASLGTFLRPRVGVEGSSGANDAVYRAAAIAPLSAQPGDWIDTRVLPIAAEIVQRIVVAGPDGLNESFRRTGEDWGVDVGGAEPVKLRSPAVGTLIGELSAMHFVEPLPSSKADEVDADAGSVEWTLGIFADGEDEVTLQLAGGLEGGQRLLLRTEAPARVAAVAVSEAAAQELVRACERVRAAAARARER